VNILPYFPAFYGYRKHWLKIAWILMNIVPAPENFTHQKGKPLIVLYNSVTYTAIEQGFVCDRASPDFL
jgi:hypothetical protein